MLPNHLIQTDANTTTAPFAEDVATLCAALGDSADTRQVLAHFEANPDTPSLPIVHFASGRPIGLINRAIFMSQMAKPFYKEIYLDRSALLFMDKEPLVVDASTPLQELSVLIANAGRKVVSDGFLIVSEGRYLGMGFVQQVLQVMADLHARHAEHLSQHRENLESLIIERTRDLVEARDEAEAAARAKTSFLANMSHEIRTPLHGVLGMAHLLQKGNLDERQRRYLGQISQSANHLLAIVNDILDLSKIGAGHMTLAKEAVSVRTVIETVIGMTSALAQGKGLALTAELPEDLPHALMGDATRLTQCLLNFVSNAIKFTEHGRVVVRCRVLENGLKALVLRFEVEDTGIGIPQEVLPALFSPFRQADDSTTRRYGGTGLGLAITKHLAELMGGSAGGSSRPGAGSVFWFSVCLEKPTVRVESASREDLFPEDLSLQIAERYAGTRILVVDDESINREILREFLAETGLLIDEADCGSTALHLHAENRYSVIFMDMQMPGMDGLAATRAIRSMPSGTSVAIVAMTANAFEEDKQRCFDAGMNDFLGKPVSPEQLQSTLLRWLDAADSATKATRPEGAHSGSRWLN